ncbi:MAG: hypothetical protein LT071_14420 [Nocardioides sp.]|nr:hypothetical protein [Nocardioides sp.]
MPDNPAGGGSTQPGPARDRRSAAPAPLVVAASVVALEALVLVALCVVELASLDSARLMMGVSTALFFLAGGVGLGAAAWALWNARRSGRGPVLMVQLVALGLAWNFRAEPTTAIAVVLAVAAVVVLAGLLSRDSMAALDHGHPDGDRD